MGKNLKQLRQNTSDILKSMRDFLYCLVFPHLRNNHRASFLHHKAIFLFIVFFIFGSLFFPSSLNPLSSKLKAIAEISVQELLDLTNEKRKEYKLPPLSNDPQLSVAASKKAEDMFDNNYWAHNSLDGTTPWFFIKDAGYNYVYAGENLARGFSDSKDVVNAWMASNAGHRENILSRNFNDVGFAVKSGKLNGEETFIVVQELGSKKVLSAGVPSNQNKINTNKVLGFNVDSYVSRIPSFSASSKIVIVFIIGMISILLIDMIVVKRKKIIRIVGHNLDHAIFMASIILVISAFSVGVIL